MCRLIHREKTFQLTALLNAWVFSWKEGQWEGCYGEDISHPAPGHRVGAAQLDSCAHPMGKLLPPHSRTAGQLFPSHRKTTPIPLQDRWTAAPIPQRAEQGPWHWGSCTRVVSTSFPLNQKCLFPTDFWQHPTQNLLSSGFGCMRMTGISTPTSLEGKAALSRILPSTAPHSAPQAAPLTWQ